MLSSIVAVSKNNVIGCNKELIWDLKPDLKRFKEITTGKTIIVGRETFLGLPFVLPNRKTIVVTKNKDFTYDHKDVQVEYDLNSVINKYKNSDEEVFIIGGGQIYKQTMDYVHKMYITHIHHNYEGDTYFPTFNEKDFKIVYKSEKNSFNNIDYTYIDYEKVK